MTWTQEQISALSNKLLTDNNDYTLLFKSYINMLQWLLGDRFFQKLDQHQDHPCYTNILACRRCIQAGHLPVNNAEEAKCLLSIFRDMYIISSTSGNSSQFDFGKFANYGDAKVVNRIRNIARDPNQFGDLMTELRVAGTFLANKCFVTAFEGDDRPDLIIHSPFLDLPLFVECKRIANGSQARAIKDDISLANKQIKRLGKKCYGIAAIDVSSRATDNRGTIEDTPLGVQSEIQNLQGSISNQNRSVSGVLLLWDFHRIMRKPWVSTSICSAGHGGQLVFHKSPRNPLPKAGLGHEFAYTVLSIVTEDIINWVVPDWMDAGHTSQCRVYETTSVFDCDYFIEQPAYSDIRF